MLVHLSKNKEGKFSFDPTAVNFLTELVKTAFALATLLALVRRAGPWLGGGGAAKLA